MYCHPERSEGSRVHPRGAFEMLHYVQHDKSFFAIHF